MLVVHTADRGGVMMPPPAARPSGASAQGGRQRRAGTPRLLIVEDDADLAGIVSSLARSLDVEAQVASNGEAALAVFRSFKPDLCLIDVLLPQLNGFEVCRRIKTELGGQQVPVVMMSSVYRTLDQIQEGLAAHGADGFLAKPFTMQKIQEMLRGYLLTPAAGEAPSSGAPQGDAGVSSTPQAAQRVLVVDDDRDLNEIITQVIRGLGMEVIQAYDGREALELAALHKPHLCMVDVLLPEVNGAAVCRMLKKTGSPAVILMSALTRTSEAVQAEQAELGADGYLLKPFPIQTLRDLVTMTLRGAGSPSGSRLSDGLVAVALEGRLGEVGLGRVLARLFLERATGTLFLRREGSRKELMLRNGSPVQARSNAISEALGSLLIERGLAQPAQISEAIGARQGARSLGVALVESGVISRAALQETLREQVRLRVVNAFAWSTGEYRFEAGPWEEGGLGEHPQSSFELLREGISRHVPFNELASRLQDRVGHYPRRTPVYALLQESFPIAAREVGLVEQLDGQRTLGQLLQTRALDVTATLNLMWCLYEAGMVEFSAEPSQPSEEAAPAAEGGEASMWKSLFGE